MTKRLICASIFAACAALATLTTSGGALAVPKDKKGIDWKRDIRAALEEAEGRGVPLLLYLTRDD